MFQITNDAKAFAKIFDQSLLKETNLHQEYVDMCNGAIKYGFRCLAINGFMIKEVAELIKGHDIDLTCGTAFPLGLCQIDVKKAEAMQALEDGATDIDLILNISKILDHDWNYIGKEIKMIADLCRKENKTSKVIFETCYLNEEEITTLCKVANECKPNFIKTCTGTHGPCTAEQVRIMRREALPEILVKASGGVHNLARVEEMLEAGADRIGTITAEQTMEEYLAKYCK